MCRLIVYLVMGLMFWTPALVIAAGQPEVELVIKDHQFTPAQLEVPANQKVKIIIDNQDPTPEEFDSTSLNREKVISGHSRGIVYIGPLKEGKTYKFIGEFHQHTAQGEVVVK